MNVATYLFCTVKVEKIYTEKNQEKNPKNYPKGYPDVFVVFLDGRSYWKIMFLFSH